MRSIFIWEKAGQDIISSWTDTILCTRRKDGTFSLRKRTIGEERTLSSSGKTRIRSPKVFVHVLLEMSNSISLGEISDEICSKINKLDHKFSKEIRAYVGTLGPFPSASK